MSMSIAMKKHLQTIAMFTYSLYFLLPMLVGCWCVAGTLILFPLTTIPMASYLGWVFFVDNSPVSGSRRPWLRGLHWWWAFACDYFPILLVKTAELDPNKKYVMGYHPHGIISVGAFGAFATDGPLTLALNGTRAPDGRGFSQLFPGIDRRLITLPQNFQTPFLREYILSLGCCNSSKETFRTVLGRGNGSAVVVVVGGAAESMLTTRGSIELVLEKRLGFVREAILGGACLVPVVAFGETDVYQVFHTSDTEWIARVQRMVKKYAGFAMPIFQGRSFFFHDFGLMPRRKPIAVVVGAPIEPPPLVDRTKFDPQLDRTTHNPLNEDGKILEEHHTKYVDALVALYKKHKHSGWNEAGNCMRGTLKIKQ